MSDSSSTSAGDEKRFDVVCVGNAIVDVLTEAEDNFLERFGLVKGTMDLVETARAEEIYNAMEERIEASGGSAANSAAGLASLGADVAFIGKVRNDALGDLYAADMAKVGVHFDTPRATEGAPTARSMIIVTPDAERTMNTYLGAASVMPSEDLSDDTLTDASVVYCEGYLWDMPESKEAISKAMELTRAAGGRAAFTLSDTFCVDRHRDEFTSLIPERVDILFANEEEIKSMFETEDLDEALSKVGGLCPVTVVTLGAEGSVVVSEEGIQRVAASPVDSVVDTTGAGDLFAAGFLYGLTHGMSMVESAELGGKTAAECIQTIGPRPARDLATLL